MITDYLWAIPVQFWAIILSTIIIIVGTLFVFFKFKKSDPTKKPSATVAIFEHFFETFSSMLDSLTGGRMKKAYPYFFTLFIFIGVTSLISLFGFEAAPTSIMFTFTLGMITFIGIYVIGVTTMGLFGFLKYKYKNPLEIFSQFSPLLSISIRLFGAAFAMAVLSEVSIMILEGTGNSNLAQFWPIVDAIWIWALAGFDAFLATIQTFVFVLLTVMYWNMNVGERKAKKEVVKKNKTTSTKLLSNKIVKIEEKTIEVEKK